MPPTVAAPAAWPVPVAEQSPTIRGRSDGPTERPPQMRRRMRADFVAHADANEKESVH
jgi:hypothetical protein